MASRKVTDMQILRACLQLQSDETMATGTNLAKYLMVSPSGLHRRLHLLRDRGYVRVVTHGDGSKTWHLEPSSLDLAGGLREGTVELYWQSLGDSQIFLSPVVR